MAYEIVHNPQNENNNGIDIRHYLYLLWYWIWLVILAGVVASVGAFLILQQVTPVFRTSTKLMVIEAAANNPTDYTSVLASERLASTYADMATNEAVLQDVIDRLGIQSTPRNLAESINVTTVRNTQLMMISVEGTNPALIANIANTLVQVLVERVEAIQSSRYSNSTQSLSQQLAKIEKDLQGIQAEIDRSTDVAEQDRLSTQALQYKEIYANLLVSYEQARLTEAQSSANIVQINLALPPVEPVQPKIPLYTGLSGMLAALLVVGIIIAVDSFDETIKAPWEVTQVLGLPVLGVIIHHKNQGQPITQEKPRSQVSEAFRSLRASIQGTTFEPLRSILVTSPSQEEGKTLVSTNLSVVLAQGGKRVVLVDADFRRPAVHKRLGLPNIIGLSDQLLQPERILEGALKITKTNGLLAITAGDLPSNPGELLWSQKTSLFLGKLKECSGMIVIDAPPMLPVADPVILAPMVDGVLLVLQPGMTTLTATKQAIEQLHHVNAKIIGAVLVNINSKKPRYQYFYRKYYRHQKTSGYYTE